MTVAYTKDMMSTCVNLAKYQTWFDMVGATRRVDIGVVRQEAKDAERLIDSMSWDTKDMLYRQLKSTFDEITKSRTYTRIPLRKFSRLLGEANAKLLEAINLNLHRFEMTMEQKEAREELQTTFVSRLDSLQQFMVDSQAMLDHRLERLEGVLDRKMMELEPEAHVASRETPAIQQTSHDPALQKVPEDRPTKDLLEGRPVVELSEADPIPNARDEGSSPNVSEEEMPLVEPS